MHVAPDVLRLFTLALIVFARMHDDGSPVSFLPLLVHVVLFLFALFYFMLGGGKIIEHLGLSSFFVCL